MKTTIKLFIFTALLLILISAIFISVSAKSAYEVKCENAEYADAIYFYSYDAKSVLFSKNEKKIVYPASTVKIMTGLIACEKLENRLDEQITVTEEMLRGQARCSQRILNYRFSEAAKFRVYRYFSII